METTEIIVTILVAVISSGILNIIVSNVISIREKKKSEESGLFNAARLLMKNELRVLCEKYISQGWIYEDELEDIMAMHSCYHNDLKGNGFLDTLMEKVKNLEIRGIGVK